MALSWELWLIERRHFCLILGAGLWLAWGISLLLGSGNFDAVGQMVGVDHLTFYSTAKLHMAGRCDEIYQLDLLKKFQNEISGPGWNSMEALRAPPFAILPYLLTDRLSYLESYWLWTAVSAILLLGCIYSSGSRASKEYYLWAFAFYPVFASITFGQNSLINLAILNGVYLLMKSKHPFFAGLLASLMFSKPQLLIGLLVWWISYARFSLKPILGITIGGVIIMLISLTIFKVETELYFENLEILLKYDLFDIWNMHNARAFFVMLLDLSSKSSQLVGAGIVAIAVLSWMMLIRREPTEKRLNIDLNFSRSIAFTLFFSPHTMIYEWSLILLPASIMLRSNLRTSDRFLAMGLITYLVFSVSTSIAKSCSLLSGHLLQISIPLMAWVTWTWLVRDTSWSELDDRQPSETDQNSANGLIASPNLLALTPIRLSTER